MINESEILDAVTSRDEYCFESLVYVPVLGRNLALTVYFDAGTDTISPRQLGLLSEFLMHSPDRLGEIQEALLGHLEEYDEWQNEDGWEFENAAEAYAACEPLCLILASDEEPNSEYPLLSFQVPWDTEHGANVWFVDGRFMYQ